MRWLEPEQKQKAPFTVVYKEAFGYLMELHQTTPSVRDVLVYLSLKEQYESD
jgi:hypothetical protein